MYRVRRLDLTDAPRRVDRLAIAADEHEDEHLAWLHYFCACRDAAADLAAGTTGGSCVDLRRADDSLVEQTWIVAKDGELTITTGH